MRGTLNLFVLSLSACAVIGLVRAPSASHPFLGLFISAAMLGTSVLLLVCADFVD
jgi:hypothetical protein